ncbi:MAG: hypothetical protein ACYC5F_03515 [Thermoleophilia bacterium]
MDFFLPKENSGFFLPRGGFGFFCRGSFGFFSPEALAFFPEGIGGCSRPLSGLRSCGPFLPKSPPFPGGGEDCGVPESSGGTDCPALGFLSLSDCFLKKLAIFNYLDRHSLAQIGLEISFDSCNIFSFTAFDGELTAKSACKSAWGTPAVSWPSPLTAGSPEYLSPAPVFFPK